MESNRRPAPEAGELWRHYNGDIYKIVAIGVHTETGEYFVVYRLKDAHDDVQAWCRPLHMFAGTVETLDNPNGEYRFTKIEHPVSTRESGQQG